MSARLVWARCTAAMMCASAVAFAGGRHAHDEPAIQIHRAGIKFAAGLFVHRHRFAGEHRLVHGGIAFGHHAVHRHAVPGAQRDQIADLQFGDGNFLFLRQARVVGRIAMRLARTDGSAPTTNFRAVCGARFSNFSSAPDARALTRASSQWPKLMSVMMAAASMK